MAGDNQQENNNIMIKFVYNIGTEKTVIIEIKMNKKDLEKLLHEDSKQQNGIIWGNNYLEELINKRKKQHKQEVSRWLKIVKWPWFNIHLVTLVLLLVVGYLFYEEWDISRIDHFWEYLSNQTVSVIIAVSVGIFIWYFQHRKQLYDNYLREFIEQVFRWYAIKENQVNARREEERAHMRKMDKSIKTDIKNVQVKIFNSNERKVQLDNERVECKGKIEVLKQLLERPSQNKRNKEAIQAIYDEYVFMDNLERLSLTVIGKFNKQSREQLKKNSVNRDNLYKYTDFRYNDLAKAVKKSLQYQTELVLRLRI